MSQTSPIEETEPATSISSPPAPDEQSQSWRDYLQGVVARSGSWWTLGVLVVIILIFGLTTSDFLSKASWYATSTSAVELLLLAVGETYVIISRGIDLSVGAVLGASGIIGAWVMSHFLGHMSDTLDVAIGAAVCCGVGVLAGALNGLVITRLNINPFVATLGMFGIASGASQLVSGGQEISNLPTNLVSTIGNGSWLNGWLPIPVFVTIVFTVVAAIFLHNTRFGKRTYAIGSNIEAATRTGIDVKRHLMGVYIISGLLAGVAGFLVTAQVAVASVQAGQDDQLSAIAAVVIGGVSLFGGRGGVAGAVIGTMIITVLDTGLVVAHVSAAWQVVAVGAILIAAVWADQQRLHFTLARRS